MLKVLLVEDEDNVRELYYKYLRLKNYNVETAIDGADALAKVVFFKPDVIVLDIIMPKLNGIELLKILKKDKELNNIPVLMLSGVSEINRIKECLELGALGYVIKGSSPEEMVTKIKHLIDLKKQSAA